MARLIGVVGVILLIIALTKAHQQRSATHQCIKPAASQCSLQSALPQTPTFQPAISSLATASAVQSQLAVMGKVRQEGFDAGEAIGKAESLKELERRRDKARERGKQFGFIEGEAKGHAAGLTMGEKIGVAKAAAGEFRKGQAQGEIYGEIKGRSEAQKESRKIIEDAERKAETRGTQQGHIDGFAEGKEFQRRESFYRVAGVAISISAAFAALLFYVYCHREPISAAAERRRSMEDRQREARLIQLHEVLTDRLFSYIGEPEQCQLAHHEQGESDAGDNSLPIMSDREYQTNGKL